MVHIRATESDLNMFFFFQGMFSFCLLPCHYKNVRPKSVVCVVVVVVGSQFLLLIQAQA